MTDPTKVVCPECGQAGIIRLPAETTGPTKLTCPRCKHVFLHVSEKRGYFRAQPLPLVRYGPFHFDFLDLTQKGKLIDLSMEGMRIRIQKIPPEKHARIGLSFSLPGSDDEIKAGAEVMWTHEVTDGTYDIGLRFFHLDPFAKAKIGFFQRT
jgi:hypothetical protein